MQNTFRTMSWLCIFGGTVATYGVGPHLERLVDLFLLRDPQAATTQPSFLNDPRLSLGDELLNGIIRGSHITRHFQWVIALMSRVIHWGVKHVLRPPSMTITSR